MNDGAGYFIGIVIIIVCIVAIAAAFSPARGHSWYPAECCSEKDCEPVADERVKLVPGGFLVDDRHFIHASQTRNSPDGEYHICWRDVTKLLPRPGCFFKKNFGS